MMFIFVKIYYILRVYNTRNNRRKTIKLKDNTREIEIERRKKINKERHSRALFLIPCNNIDITPRCKFIYLCEGFQSDNCISFIYIIYVLSYYVRRSMWE